MQGFSFLHFCCIETSHISPSSETFLWTPAHRLSVCKLRVFVWSNRLIRGPWNYLWWLQISLRSHVSTGARQSISSLILTLPWKLSLACRSPHAWLRIQVLFWEKITHHGREFLCFHINPGTIHRAMRALKGEFSGDLMQI